MSDLFIKAMVLHLIVDFLLQTTWMAHNKSRFGSLASWMHGGMHALAAAVAGFTGPAVLVIGLGHMFIDTYIPLRLWIRFIRPELHDKREAFSITVGIWADQTFHLSLLLATALVVT